MSNTDDKNSQDCASWCGDGCTVGCKGSECLGCQNNPSSLF